MVEPKSDPWARVWSWWLLLVVATVAPAAGQGQARVSVSGQFVVYWVDDFEGGGSHAAYRLRQADGDHSFDLLFTVAPADLHSGDQVTVQGIETAPGVLHVEQYERRRGVTNAAGGAAEGPAAPPVGEQRTAVLLLDFRDATQGCTAAGIEERLFSASDSVNRLYQETSSGKVSFAGTAFGPFLIDDYRSQHCNPVGWADAANALATAAGVDLRAYPRRLYLIATNPGWTCGWGGISDARGDAKRVGGRGIRWLRLWHCPRPRARTCAGHAPREHRSHRLR